MPFSAEFDSHYAALVVLVFVVVYSVVATEPDWVVAELVVGSVVFADFAVVVEVVHFEVAVDAAVAADAAADAAVVGFAFAAAVFVAAADVVVEFAFAELRLAWVIDFVTVTAVAAAIVVVVADEWSVVIQY